VTRRDIFTNRANRRRCCWFRAARWAIVVNAFADEWLKLGGGASCSSVLVHG
jgi:hypothetical protein